MPDDDSLALIRYLLFALAGLLVVGGLKFTSIGVGAGNLLQSDGYNVTGGLMTLVGGLTVGYLIGSRSKA